MPRQPRCGLTLNWNLWPTLAWKSLGISHTAMARLSVIARQTFSGGKG
jgi:hypothetical protein